MQIRLPPVAVPPSLARRQRRIFLAPCGQCAGIASSTIGKRIQLLTLTYLFPFAHWNARIKASYAEFNALPVFRDRPSFPYLVHLILFSVHECSRDRGNSPVLPAAGTRIDSAAFRVPLLLS